MSMAERVPMLGDWDVLGHDAGVSMLQRCVLHGNLSHAYLFAGPPSVGKSTLARELALSMVCTPASGDAIPCRTCAQCRLVLSGHHPDVVTMTRAADRRDILIDQIREMQQRVMLRPYQARRSVQIIEEADSLNEAAANALLKTLEEPPGHALLILTAVDEEALPATIRSRCQIITLRPVPNARIAGWLEGRWSIAAGQARTLAALSNGRPGWAREAVANPQLVAEHDARIESTGGLLDLDPRARSAAVPRFLKYASFNENRQAAADVLDLLLRWMRDLLVIVEGLPDLVTFTRQFERLESQTTRCTHYEIQQAIQLVRQAIDDIEHNLTPRLVLETLLLQLPSAGGGGRQSSGYSGPAPRPRANSLTVPRAVSGARR